MSPKKLALAIIEWVAAVLVFVGIMSPPPPNKGASVERDRWLD